MTTFSDRIAKALADGDMTVGDLQTWFERPYPTVRQWRFAAIVAPTGPRGREAERRLRLLEKAIQDRHGFPVPVALSNLARPDYLRKIRHDLENAGVPKSDPA